MYTILKDVRNNFNIIMLTLLKNIISMNSLRQIPQLK